MCHRPQLLLLLCCQRLRERAMETEISRQKEKETEWGEIWGYTTAIQISPATSDPSVSPSVCLSITSTFSTVSFFLSVLHRPFFCSMQPRMLCYSCWFHWLTQTWAVLPGWKICATPPPATPELSQNKAVFHVLLFSHGDDSVMEN